MLIEPARVIVPVQNPQRGRYKPRVDQPRRCSLDQARTEAVLPPMGMQVDRLQLADLRVRSVGITGRAVLGRPPRRHVDLRDGPRVLTHRSAHLCHRRIRGCRSLGGWG
jgi:hypothetical protein